MHLTRHPVRTIHFDHEEQQFALALDRHPEKHRCRDQTPAATTHHRIA